MDIAQNINQFFLSISTFLINVVWGRVLPSHSSIGSPAFDLESQSLEAPAQLQSQPPQPPRSAMEIELQPPPPAQQPPPPAINPQQINMVIVGQISRQWPNVVLQFCLQAAIQIALQYETTQHPKLPVSFYLRSFFILLTFTSLFVSHLIRNKSPDISRVLEKAATFLAATVFFTTMATPFTLARK